MGFRVKPGMTHFVTFLFDFENKKPRQLTSVRFSQKPLQKQNNNKQDKAQHRRSRAQAADIEVLEPVVEQVLQQINGIVWVGARDKVSLPKHFESI